MANTARSEFTQEKATAAYKYLRLTREQLLDRLIVMAASLDEDIVAGDSHAEPNPNERFLITPHTISPKAYRPFTDYVDYLIFRFVRAEVKSRSLSMLRETKKDQHLSLESFIQLGVLDPIRAIDRDKDILSLTGKEINDVGDCSGSTVRLHWRVSILTVRAVMEMTSCFAKLPDKFPPEFGAAKPESVPADKSSPVAVKAAASATTLRLTSKEAEIVAAYRNNSLFRRRTDRLVKALKQ